MNAVGLNVPSQGTILPGTTIHLGRYTVVIDRYIAEGGFAHVYLATLANGTGFPLVVKRIAVADKERLAIVNKEIEIMRCLGKHKNIPEYLESCMGKLEGGGYEVLILMEYCGGGSVIDLMNRRLQHRLTEPEILKIFSNVCEAVAYLHYSDPPILHRDIKVENILLSNNDYKLCDFGSATTNILRGENIPRNVKDIQLLEEEINNHTTLQYRAPEMLDLYMRKGIDEKIDIWALGVLLYKLCYYTTPFEDQGQLAILNVRYTIPDNPVFSSGLIGLFKSMLQEDPRQRPNIYQVMTATSALRGLPCPIQNIYPEATFMPSVMEPQTSVTANILSNSAVAKPIDVLPSIEPMRRGRPARMQAAIRSSTPTGDASATASLNSGFDDSFGQFAQTTDPASQFSKIPPTGDAFDFGSPMAFNSPKKVDAKRFTLDLDSGTDEFGFSFSNMESQSSTPAVPAASAPDRALRPSPPFMPSLNLQSESHPSNLPTTVKNTIPSEQSRASSGAVAKIKPTVDDLFFGSSADIQFSDGGFRASTPSSFGDTQKAPTGMSKPPLVSLQTTRQLAQSSSPARSNAAYPTITDSNSLGIFPNGTGDSRKGPSATSQPRASDITPRGERLVNTNGINNSGKNRNDSYASTDSSTGPLHRQQIEQLGKFSLHSGPPRPQSSQGKVRALDPSNTLDGMRSGSAPSSASIPLTLNVQGQASSPTATSSNIPGTLSNLPILDKKGLAQKDLDSELKLIQLQQKEFERQQQELLALQRQQLEGQQQQHRLQQEQLQKQQQQQIQVQHEKWQERKRMLKEQEQLAQRQAIQQKDLEKQHESQQQRQQQEQQDQQHHLPDVSNLVSSMGSISLSTTNRAALASTGQNQQQQQQMNTYRNPLSGAGAGQRTAAISPSATMSAGGAEHFSSMGGSRPSIDAQDRPTSGGHWSHSSATSSPVTSFQTSFSATTPSVGPDTSLTAPLAPSVPTKSARRAAINGSGAPLSSTSAGSTSAGSTSKTTGAKTRRISINSLPPGQKPELLPKPTRFRMKDGTGTLVAGEEEAFNKKFPSADLGDNLMQLPLIPSSSRDGDVISGYGYNTLSFVNGSSGYNAQYATPHTVSTEVGEDEEEEETLVRSKRRQYNLAGVMSASSTHHGKQVGSQIDAEEPTAPVESVRERIQRMNRGMH